MLTCLALSLKVEMRTLYDPIISLSDIYPEEILAYKHEEIYRKCLWQISCNSPKLEIEKCLIVEWRVDLVYIYIMEKANKMNDIFTYDNLDES